MYINILLDLYLNSPFLNTNVNFVIGLIIKFQLLIGRKMNHFYTLTLYSPCYNYTLVLGGFCTVSKFPTVIIDGQGHL